MDIVEDACATGTAPVWAEIDLGGLRRNLATLRGMLPAGVKVYAVIKADAYGHGAVAIARALQTHGIDGLVIANVVEGAPLRDAGITVPILVLDPPLKEQAGLFGTLDLTATVTSEEEVLTLAATAGKIGRHLPVHVRIDINFAGLGVPSAATVDFLADLARIGGLRVEGLYTHIAGPYRGDGDETAAELALFEQAAAMAERAGLLPPLVHILSSSGLMMKAGRTVGNMVRPGSLLYGIRMVPGPEPFPFDPVMAVKARILRTTMLGAGTNVGYRPGIRIDRPIRAAVVPFGFSDGHHLHSGAGGEILIGGRRVPIVGDAFMSCLLADISGLPDVAPGDEAILIGRQGDEIIAVEEVAARSGLRPSAIPFLGQRVARTYRTGSEAFSQNHG